ncbi:MAG: hypothetical protein J7513_18240 [Solirubrobacteraceae bacterium]|nr:hypothetical protein [Solirubrobacteraceae bacterium]
MAAWAEEAWTRLAALPLQVDEVSLSFPSITVRSGWERVTTVIALHGAGEEGLGEDVTYEAEEHRAVEAAGAPLDATGQWTLGSFCERVAATDLFPSGAPDHDVSRNYRRWAWESAALDLALRQAGTDLGAVLGLETQPVSFVASTRLGEPSAVSALDDHLAAVPDLRFKLDAAEDWDEAFLTDLAALDRTDCIDLKAFYTGTVVDVSITPEQTLAIANAIPDCTLEDVAPGLATELIAAEYPDRLSWDAPILSVADLEALPIAPSRMNVKPSRIGSIAELLAVHGWLRDRDVASYGGGQFELSVGRGQIILLASLLHPSTPNDVAPVEYHAFQPGGTLPASPLTPAGAVRGFRWPGH